MVRKLSLICAWKFTFGGVYVLWNRSIQVFNIWKWINKFLGETGRVNCILVLYLNTRKQWNKKINTGKVRLVIIMTTWIMLWNHVEKGSTDIIKISVHRKGDHKNRRYILKLKHMINKMFQFYKGPYQSEHVANML